MILLGNQHARTHLIKKYDSRYGYGNVGETEELAEHAGVERHRLLAQMARTMVVDALGALGLSRLLVLVQVEG